MEGALLNNRYRILQTLGIGGCSQTFLALDTYMPSERRCVLKQLRPITQNPRLQQWIDWQFQREAAILEQLGEKNSQIPQLYAYFFEAGQFYLVQEWIDGITLSYKQQQQGKISEQEVREILLSLLPVIDYIHSRNIIHRDIKPENIILRTVDRLPVLIDFGAVQEAMTTLVKNSKNTCFSMGIGTPGYMSPEQIIGCPVYASDLYSLGLTAISLLTGKAPQDLPIDLDTGEILWYHETPHLRTNLAAVIERAVRFYWGDRFSSAQEMLAALQSPPLSITFQLIEKTNNIQKQITTKVANALLPQLIHAQSSTKGVKQEFLPTKTRKNKFSKVLSLCLIAGVEIGVFIVALELLSTNKYFTHNFAFKLTELPSSSLPFLSIKYPQSEPVAVENKMTDEVSHLPKSVTPESQKSLLNMPIFVPGIPEEEIFSALGEPDWRRKGYWANSIAWIYQDIVPEQVDLGYLFDTKTKRLRQTEIALAQSVKLETLQFVLDTLLRGNTPISLKQKSKQIYQYEINVQEFEIDDLKGIIQRNEKNKIYIGIWEADFH
ncbi:serine/threonine protein kinase [Pleurocapsales cyanobacterium LEGE 06147]|nr:serine/threonine protein kinase [Pleurocapsales cyanobacterium LEGE 06147]